MTATNSPQRDAQGRFLERGGPGRKPLPDWLKDGEEDLLRIQFAAAVDGRIPLADPGAEDEPELADDGSPIPPSRTQVVDPKLRVYAAECLLNRIRGKAPIAPEDEKLISPMSRALARLTAEMGDDEDEG